MPARLRRRVRRRPASAVRARPPSPSRRPMSSRSSAAASPTPRLRGASTSSPNGKPRQNGRPRPTSGWTKRSRTSAACAANSSAVPFQNQSPTGGSPPSSGRRGLAGVVRPARRAAKRTPGAAAAARCARSRRLGDVEEHEPGSGDRRGRKGGGVPVVGSLVGGGAHEGPAGSACFARPASDASRPPRRAGEGDEGGRSLRGVARRGGADGGAAPSAARRSGQLGVQRGGERDELDGLGVAQLTRVRALAEAEADAVQGVRVLEQPEDAEGALRLRQTARRVRAGRQLGRQLRRAPRSGRECRRIAKRTTAASAGARSAARPSSSARATLLAPCPGSTPSPWRPMSCQSAALQHELAVGLAPAQLGRAAAARGRALAGCGVTPCSHEKRRNQHSGTSGLRASQARASARSRRRRAGVGGSRHAASIAGAPDGSGRRSAAVASGADRRGLRAASRPRRPAPATSAPFLW